MKEPTCGGCTGQGAHSRRCRTQPGWLWYRLEDMAEELGDLIGSNDPAAANSAYAIAAKMRQKANAAKHPESVTCARCGQPIGAHGVKLGDDGPPGCRWTQKMVMEFVTGPP